MQVCQKGIELADKVYELTRSPLFNKDRKLAEQIRGAAVSVPSNIAEGFERGSNKEFIQFLFVAKGSAGEVRTQLYIARNQKYITTEEFESTTAWHYLTIYQ